MQVPALRYGMTTKACRLLLSVHLLDGGGDGAVDDRGKLAELGDEFGELVGEEGLRAVGHGLVGVGVHFHEEAVRAGRDRGECERWNEIALANAVRRIAENGEVRELFEHRDGGDV